MEREAWHALGIVLAIIATAIAIHYVQSMPQEVTYGWDCSQHPYTYAEANC